MKNCKWCGREQEDNAGAYYHEASCHAHDVRRRIEELDASLFLSAAYIKARKKLQAELEQAEYVGD